MMKEAAAGRRTVPLLPRFGGSHCEEWEREERHGPGTPLQEIHCATNCESQHIVSRAVYHRLYWYSESHAFWTACCIERRGSTLGTCTGMMGRRRRSGRDRTHRSHQRLPQCYICSPRHSRAECTTFHRSRAPQSIILRRPDCERLVLHHVRSGDSGNRRFKVRHASYGTFCVRYASSGDNFWALLCLASQTPIFPGHHF